MYVVPKEKGWKDDSNDTKDFKSPKINFQGFRNKATTCVHYLPQ